MAGEGRELAHLCRLASLSVAMVRDPEFDPRGMTDADWHNTRNCLVILADAFVGLLNRSPEMKPAFRIPAPADRPETEGRDG